MTTSYVALLRGINVGGRSKLSMADLRAAFADTGFDDVSTYIQSGNVLFRSSRSPAALPGAIEEVIDAAFGLTVRALLRTSTELADVVAHNPLATGGRDMSRLHVTFLAAAPAPPRVAALDSGPFLPDEFGVRGREIYLHCPGGYGRTKLNNTFFERTLEAVATTRNWKTVTTLADLSS